MTQAPSDERRRTRRRKTAAAYRPSHQRVLRHVTASPDRPGVPLDAVVVPTNRLLKDLPGLRLAARIARDRGSWLVLVCSGKARPEQVPAEVLAGLEGRVAILELDAVDARLLPDLLTDGHTFGWRWRRNDVGRKRNLGIALAVLSGWRHILFLDDDVWPAAPDAAGHGLPEEIAAALAQFRCDRELRAVGWTLHDFDDNSVAGHGRKLAGMDQDVFVGGAALAVSCDAETPFFPSVYNEDWLFLMALAMRAPRWDRSIASGGRLHQLVYNPWQSKRACSEEQGDVLAEGLMNLLEEDGPGFWGGALDPLFWGAAIHQRRSMIARIARQVPRGHPAADALRATDLVDLEKDEFVDYVDRWKRDLGTWAEHLAALPGDPAARLAAETALARGVEAAARILKNEEVVRTS